MKVQKISAFATPSCTGYEGGNPAGVVLLNTFPTEQEMISLAAEVGYSETVFATPIANQTNAYRVRYFSPEGEVPFCGHATIALGAGLISNLNMDSDSNEQEKPDCEQSTEALFQLILNHAHVGLRVDKTKAGTVVTLRSPPTSHQIIDEQQDKELTRLLDNVLDDFGIKSDELDKQIPPAIVNGGSKHLALTVKNQSTLENMSYDFESVKRQMHKHGLVTIILARPLLDRAENKHLTIDVRNAFASGGVVEDPATGAAAAAYAGYLRDSNTLPSLISSSNDKTQPADKNKKSEYQLTFLQGHYIKMPSIIYASLSDEIGSPIGLSGYTQLIN